MKSYVLEFSYVWSCKKISQGQPQAIIWTILVVLEYSLLYIKFQGNQSTGSREEFLRFLPWTSMTMRPRQFSKLYTIFGYS